MRKLDALQWMERHNQMHAGLPCVQDPQEFLYQIIADTRDRPGFIYTINRKGSAVLTKHHVAEWQDTLDALNQASAAFYNDILSQVLSSEEFAQAFGDLADDEEIEIHIHEPLDIERAFDGLIVNESDDR